MIAVCRKVEQVEGQGFLTNWPHRHFIDAPPPKPDRLTGLFCLALLAIRPIHCLLGAICEARKQKLSIRAC